MASFVILLIARTARIACSDRHTYIHTDTHTHETTTVTLSAHARRGLTIRKRNYYSKGDHLKFKANKILICNRTVSKFTLENKIFFTNVRLVSSNLESSEIFDFERESGSIPTLI